MEKTLEEIYRKDFSGDNKYVDIIYHHHSIIGFSLYELVRLEAYPNHLFLHWIDAVIEKNYRQEGLITLLVFRATLLLQILHPDLIISLFCVSITQILLLLKNNNDQLLIFLFPNFPHLNIYGSRMVNCILYSWHLNFI